MTDPIVTPKDIRYAVTSKDETRVSIVVKYWPQGYDLSLSYNIELPIDFETNTVPTGDELRALIMHNAPVGQLDMMVRRFKAAVMVDLSHIDELIAKK